MKLKLKQFIYIIVIAVFILITVFPIFWALVSSLRSDEEIFRYAMPFSWRTFVPDKLTFQSYINVFVEKHFGKVLFNTIFVGVATIVTGIIVNAVAGFIFAKYTFRFKRLLFFLVVLSFMVPFEAVSIPLYKMITVLKWENTYIALILPTVANGLVIFLFKQFFEEIPNSLMESATVEGAGMFTIFTKIVIPNSIPVIQKAKELLRDLQNKVYDVAYQTGFNDARYFSQVFRKETGLTPTQYREKFCLDSQF